MLRRTKSNSVFSVFCHPLTPNWKLAGLTCSVFRGFGCCVAMERPCARVRQRSLCRQIKQSPYMLAPGFLARDMSQLSARLCEWSETPNCKIGCYSFERCSIGGCPLCNSPILYIYYNYLGKNVAEGKTINFLAIFMGFSRKSITNICHTRNTLLNVSGSNVTDMQHQSSKG